MSDDTTVSPTHRLLQLPKRGCAISTCEDKFASNEDEQGRRYALADGASDTIYAGFWAELLVEAYRKQPVFDAAEWLEWLRPLRQAWSERVDKLELSWPNEHRRPDGAGATLVGLELRTDFTWRASGVGDACLFQMRGSEVIAKFPMERSADFNNFPKLVGSRWARNSDLRQEQGQWKHGDHIVMATDAVAAWFLAECEANRDPNVFVRRVLALASGSPEQAEEIDHLRSTGELRDDDVTLVLIEV